MDLLATVIPAAARGLPPDMHQEYITAVMAALRPVFLAAAGISALGFALTFLLREHPLREGAPAEGVGESFAMPRAATSLEGSDPSTRRRGAPENAGGPIPDLARGPPPDRPAPGC